MYISRICLDPRKRDTMIAMLDRGIIHTAMESSVQGDRPHILWRIERGGSGPSIIAVSKEIPYLGDIQERFGRTDTRPATKPYAEYVGSISNGDLLRFRIEVNPVVNVNDGSKNGKDVPLNLRKTANHPFCAEDWIVKKLSENGAEVTAVRDVGNETACFYKDGRRIPIFTVTYEGTMLVRDSELVKKAMETGIGGKKTYGCGMLTVIKAGRASR